jgi:hypothetical protein
MLHPLSFNRKAFKNDEEPSKLISRLRVLKIDQKKKKKKRFWADFLVLLSNTQRGQCHKIVKIVIFMIVKSILCSPNVVNS